MALQAKNGRLSKKIGKNLERNGLWRPQEYDYMQI